MKMQKVILTVLLLMAFLCSCTNKTAITPTEATATTDNYETEATVETISNTTEPTEAEIIVIEKCENVFEYLNCAGFDLVYTIIYDETNDPNGSGKHPYIEKASFIDGRKVENYNDDSPLSGTIEFFENSDLAVERAAQITDSTYQVYAAQIISGSCLLRLGYDYSEEEIANAAKSINGEVFSNLNSSTYDSLDSSYEIGDYSFPISHSWEVKKESNNLLYLYPHDSNGWITVSYNTSAKINSNYLNFMQGALRGAKATFVSAEVVTVDDVEAIKYLATTEISGREYYMLSLAFDGELGHYGFVLTEPITTTDKIEVYFHELIAEISKSKT